MGLPCASLVVHARLALVKPMQKDFFLFEVDLTIAPTNPESFTEIAPAIWEFIADTA